MLKTILLVYTFIFLQMLAVWFIYLTNKNPGIVDVAWPIGLVVSGIIFLHDSISTRTVIAGTLLVIWGTRLAGYLWYTRVRKHEIDKRYLQISANWHRTPALFFLLNYQLQGILILAIALVFYPIATVSMLTLNWLDVVAFITIAIGIVGETIADFQLHQFRNHHPGKVCNVGFWRYSRHPNYFCDWLVWSGFALLGMRSHVFYLGLIAPILLYWIFNYVTGPLTEAGSIKSRGQAFLDYQKKTNQFFPWYFTD